MTAHDDDEKRKKTAGLNHGVLTAIPTLHIMLLWLKGDAGARIRLGCVLLDGRMSWRARLWHYNVLRLRARRMG